MPQVTAAEFSRLAGVSKVAISKLVNANPPRLIVEGGKLDTDNPINAMYLARSHEGGRQATPKTKAPKPDPDDQRFQAAVRKRQAKKAQATESLDGADDISDAEKKKLAESIQALMLDTADLDRQKKVQSIALQRAQELRHLFKLAQDKKTVVPRETVRRALALMNASITTNVLQSPRMAVPQLFAMAKAGASTQEGIVALEKILGTAVSHVVEEVAGAI